MINQSPPPALDQWRELIEAKSQELNVDRIILASQIWTESAGVPKAYRYEHLFTWFLHPTRGPLHDSRLSTTANRQNAEHLLGSDEFNFQSASHGLLQVMGSVARELGYDGTPKDFYDPATNVHFGCLKIKQCLKQANGDMRNALKRYNGSFRYADLVLHRADILENM